MNNAKQQGFSLLEILVAFSILAVSVTILLHIFALGVNTVTVAEDYSQAVQLAESLMAKTGVETPLKAGQISGLLNDKYHWQVFIEPFIFNAQTTNTSASLFKVKVVVYWGDTTQHRQIKLISLKLANKRL